MTQKEQEDVMSAKVDFRMGSWVCLCAGWGTEYYMRDMGDR